jgi:hypothetical protein
MLIQTKPWAGMPRQVALGILCWLVLTVSGLAVLTVYSLTPGETHPPVAWAEAGLPGEIPAGKHLLVMALHPHCPCTRASLGELARVLRFVPTGLVCRVLVYQPANGDPGWQATDIVRSAAALPHTELITDLDGQEAAQLGMVTSGAVVLYDPYGRVQFSGGITAARNHHGDNQGADAVRAIVARQRPTLRQTSVYGCPIQAGLQDMSTPPCCEVTQR